MVAKLSIGVIVLLICTFSLLFSASIRRNRDPTRSSKINMEELWESAESGGWRPSSAPRSDWPPPTEETNGYLRVRCNGGLNQQRSAICNAVLAARIMNATLVLPELDANSFWHDDSGFQGIYDVEHFIKTLKYDVKIVGKIPDVLKNGKTKKIKAFQAMKEHSAIYLTPFLHRLAEEIDNPEYQRLRCRVNYHALRFKPHIMKLSESIVDKLRSQGHFMSIHLRFEMDMLAFAGCFDIFNPEEQKILKKYRKENFAEKRLIYNERRAIGKCPLTPEEVDLILRAMRFDNSTRIYLAAGELFGGERFMKPFRTLFPRLDNHSSVDPSSEELSPTNSQGLIGSAVDYMVCLMSDIFMPTPDRKGFAPVFVAREKGKTAGLEEAVRRVMMKTNFGGPHKRVSPESFYTNSWPECFCQVNPKKGGDKCPPDSVLDSRLESVGDSDSTSQTDSTVVGLGR
uniref:O-fucosyltransferase family protein n=1 Tax=Brassica campestris TaxID=3711 RepID=M4EUK5_BRACM